NERKRPPDAGAHRGRSAGGPEGAAGAAGSGARPGPARQPRRRQRLRPRPGDGRGARRQVLRDAATSSGAAVAGGGAAGDGDGPARRGGAGGEAITGFSIRERAMSRTFCKDGLVFTYPDDWTLEEEPDEFGWTATVQSPSTAFLMVRLDKLMNS